MRGVALAAGAVRSRQAAPKAAFLGVRATLKAKATLRILMPSKSADSQGDHHVLTHSSVGDMQVGISCEWLNLVCMR